MYLSDEDPPLKGMLQFKREELTETVSDETLPRTRSYSPIPEEIVYPPSIPSPCEWVFRDRMRVTLDFDDLTIRQEAKYSTYFTYHSPESRPTCDTAFQACPHGLHALRCSMCAGFRVVEKLPSKVPIMVKLKRRPQRPTEVPNAQLPVKKRKPSG